jgi:hypothetical protein
MLASDPVATPTTRLADRLAALRDRSFIGRSAELELFESALRGAERAFSLLFVYGPGGIGKTVLLREFGRVAESMRATVARLDARDIDPSPAGFLAALARALDVDDGATALRHLTQVDLPLLLIDTYEVLTPLDDWLREELLPQLPSSALVVLGGRLPPRHEWRADPAWSQLMHVLPLRNLLPSDSRAYLETRGIAQTHHEAVLGFTHGHPLALSLLADMLVHTDETRQFRPEHAPDVVRSLLQRFVEDVPSRAHWQALAVCAHARVTTEDLLSNVLGSSDGPALFRWLRELPFVEHGPRGIFPHDLAREVLEADLRWRDPPTYRDLHNRIREALAQRLRGSRGLERQSAYFDLMYLLRHSDVAAPFYDWASFGHLYAEQATADDYAEIVAMVRHHEGDESARIAEYWLVRHPRGFVVFRGARRHIAGFAGILVLETVTEADRAADPAMAAVWSFCERHGHPRPGEQLIHHRFFVGRDHYQDTATHNMVAMVANMRWSTIPRLAWCFAAVAEPERWRPMFEAIRFPRCEEADYVVGGRRYCIFVHDWRVDPHHSWLTTKVALESDSQLQAPVVSEPLIVLSEPDFISAVRQALRDYRTPQLAHNPLLRSRLAHEHAGGTPTVATLQALIREVTEEFRDSPRDAKLYRCLELTYLQPVGTQELAAERLGLPFNTYRYQLAAAIARVSNALWQRELRVAAA